MKRYIRFDWVIKHMLRDKSNYVVVEGFLSELLRQDIRIEEVLESESNKTNADAKLTRVDLLVKNRQGHLMIIELQYETELDYFHRILFGASKLLTEYLKEGEPYSNVKKIYSISIVYFDLGVGQDYVYRGTTSFHGLHWHDELQLNPKQQALYGCHRIADIYPEFYLIKIEKFQDIVADALDQWVYFLKHDDIRENFDARGIYEAKEKLDVVKLEPQARRSYEAFIDQQHYEASMWESKKQEGFLDGYEEGKKNGEEAKALAIARQLLGKMTDAEIRDITGLPVESIQSLRDNSHE